MLRLRDAVRSYRVTPLALILLIVLVIGLVVGVFGPNGAQPAGFVVAVLVALVFAVGAFPGGLHGARLRGLEERREQFPERDRDDPEPLLDPSREEQLWRAERERYEQDNN